VSLPIANSHVGNLNSHVSVTNSHVPVTNSHVLVWVQFLNKNIRVLRRMNIRKEVDQTK